jgi:hypothetical protein
MIGAGAARKAPPPAANGGMTAKAAPPPGKTAAKDGGIPTKAGPRPRPRDRPSGGPGAEGAAEAGVAGTAGLPSGAPGAMAPVAAVVNPEADRPSAGTEEAETASCRGYREVLPLAIQPGSGSRPAPALRRGDFRAPVAQLDRALPSEGRGHRFDSCLVYQLPKARFWLNFEG